MSGKFSVSNTRAAKLTADQVLEIRRLYHDERWSQPKLSRAYGVSSCQIGRIVRGESWQQYANVTSDAELEHIAATSGYKPTEEELADSMALLERLRSSSVSAEVDSLEEVLRRRGGSDPLRRLRPEDGPQQTEETRNDTRQIEIPVAGSAPSSDQRSEGDPQDAAAGGREDAE